MDTEQAKTAIAGDLPENGTTLDEAADALIVRIGQFFGECAGGDTFCGLSVDETRDANGLLTSLKLVPCDLVNGEPVRREGKFREPQIVAFDPLAASRAAYAKLEREAGYRADAKRRGYVLDADGEYVHPLERRN